MGDNQRVRPRTLTGFRTLAHQRNGRVSPGRNSPENRKLGPRHLTGTPEAIQQRSTATSWTASGSEGLLSVADLPQRPRMTSPPRVRIEGSRTWLFGWAVRTLVVAAFMADTPSNCTATRVAAGEARSVDRIRPPFLRDAAATPTCGSWSISANAARKR